MSRWAGPPPLLVLATLLAILVAPAVSSADEGEGRGTSSPGASLASGPTAGDAPDADSPGAGRAAEETPGEPETAAPTDAPVAPPAPRAAPVAKPRLLGVASFNQYRPLSFEEARADALTLADRTGISIIGWQEGYGFGPVYSALRKRGWDTKRFTDDRSSRELAVSWRRDRFELAGAVLHRAAAGVDKDVARYPFGDRYVLRVTLREKATGERISVVNTHLPQAIEDLDRPGRWRDTINAVRAQRQLQTLRAVFDRAPGRWVVGTGDYNFGASADADVRPRGGISRTFGDAVVSTYQLLGRRDVEPTHPYSGRYIDYVHVRRGDLDEGRLEVLGHRTFSNVESDHLPLVAWLRIR